MKFQWKKFQWKNEKFKNYLVPAKYFAWSLILNFFIEACSRHSVIKAATYMVHSPVIFLYNAFLIAMPFLLVYLVRFKKFMFSLISLLWIAAGIGNGVTLYTRVTPFCAADLTMLGDVIPIMTLYMTVWQAALIFIALGVAIVFLIIYFIKSPRYREEMHWKKRIVLTAAVIALFAVTTKTLLATDILSAYFSNVAYAYEDYGFPYGFATSVFDMGMSQPSHYSENHINKIVAKDEQAAEDDTTQEKHPNILFLQLETFFDPTLLNTIELSEDPVPNFHQLMNQYSSGYYNVPVVGAGTANTEFESITGMNMRFFGPGEYPYKTVMKNTTCDSMAYALKNIGYSTHAIHDNNAEFYGRNEVFPKLGFDDFTSIETMHVTKTNYLGWADDSVLTKYIMVCMEQTEGPDYIYTISVQGHGQYPSDKLYEDPPIKVTANGEMTEERLNQWTYYVNQVHEMDEFVGELIDALSNQDEDVILVMYGDHLPTMELQAKDVKTGYLYSTEYVIWNNMGLDKIDKNISAYQMGATVLERVGIHQGIMLQYHQNRMGTSGYLQDLETLQYDMLYGEHYSYPNHETYEATDMKFGILPITIKDVEITSQNICYVFGENFTQYSKVSVNGKFLDTEFLSTGVLVVRDEDISPGDVITVGQVSSSDLVLSETDGYTVP